MGTLPDGFSASRRDSRPNRTAQAAVRKRRPHDNFRVRVRPARGSCAARRQGHDCGNPYIAGMECRSGAARPLIAAHRARSSRHARTIRRDRGEGPALNANRDSQPRKSENLEQDWPKASAYLRRRANPERNTPASVQNVGFGTPARELRSIPESQKGSKRLVNPSTPNLPLAARVRVGHIGPDGAVAEWLKAAVC